MIGTLAALRHRDATGLGQYVDVAMYDAMVAMTDMVPFLWSMGAPASMAGPGSTALVGAFAARDGHFVVAVFREPMFEKLCRLLGHPEWLADPRFADRTGWARHTEDVIRPALEAWAKDMTQARGGRGAVRGRHRGGPEQPRRGHRARPARRGARHADRGAAARRGAALPRGRQPGEDVAPRRGPGARRRRGSASTPTSVLRSVLSLRDDEIAALRAQGAIG